MPVSAPRLRYQCVGSQLGELRWCSLGEGASNREQAFRNSVAMPSRLQGLQVFDRQLGRPVAEHEETGTKNGLQRSKLFVLQSATERLAALVRVIRVARCLQLGQPAIDRSRHERCQRVLAEHPARPSCVEVDDIGDSCGWRPLLKAQ